MTNSSDDAGLRQLRRRGGGVFVEAMKQRDLNEMKAAIVAYEETPYCPEARNRVRIIKMHCFVTYDDAEFQQAIRDAYDSIWNNRHPPAV